MKALTVCLTLTFILPFIAQAKTEAELLREVQVGSEWGKVVAHDALPNMNSSLARAAHAFGEFKGGSAFIIRTNDPNRLIFATNAHVMVDDNDLLAGDLSAYRSNPELACHERDSMERPIEKV